jgi:hypothetical protein
MCGGFGNVLFRTCFLHDGLPIPQSSMHAAIAPQCNAERLRASCTAWSSGVSCTSTLGPGMQAGRLMCGGFGNGLLLSCFLRDNSPAPQSSMHAAIAPQCHAERLRASCTERSTGVAWHGEVFTALKISSARQNFVATTTSHHR